MTPNYDALTSDALYYDYSSAANPIRQGLMPPVPYHSFSGQFFEEGQTRIQPLDISAALGCPSPATSPALCANYIRIVKGSVMTTAEATSQLFFVHKGLGRTDACGESIYWTKGDYLVLPPHGQAMHYAEEKAGLYWVHDAPLLRYLGVSPSVERFKPTLFEYSKAETKLKSIANDPVNSAANRVSVLLANRNFPQTRTVTHTLWAMFGLLPAGKVQYPHRHESVALDFVVDCKPGRTGPARRWIP